MFGYPEMSLREVVHHLGNDVYPEINFIIPPDHGDLVLPELSLRSVNLEDILTAIQFSTDAYVYAKMMNDNRLVVFNVRQRQADKSKPVLRAYSLKNYLPADLPKPDLLGDNVREQHLERTYESIRRLHQTLETSFEMMREADPGNASYKDPRISVERESGLLIAVGTPDSLEIVDQVVGALTKQNTTD